MQFLVYYKSIPLAKKQSFAKIIIFTKNKIILKNVYYYEHNYYFCLY